MASAAELSISRTRLSLSLGESSACNCTGLTPEGGMRDFGRGEGRGTGWRGIHGAVNMLPADTTLYTRSSSLVAAEDRQTGYVVCSFVSSPSAELARVLFVTTSLFASSRAVFTSTRN